MSNEWIEIYVETHDTRILATWFEVLSLHLSGGSEEKHENPRIAGIQGER
jgi:hypothetical protein